MASLADILKQNLATAGQPIGIEDNTEKARQLARAGSGKELRSGGAVSNIAEQVATDQANQKLADVSQRAAAVSANIEAGQEQLVNQEKLAQTDTDLAKQAQDQQFSQEMQQVARLSDRARQETALSRATAVAEQKAANRALGNKQYLYKLATEAERARLDNGYNFMRKLEANNMGNNEEILRQMLNNKEVLVADSNAFARKVSAIDLDTARQVANNAIQDAKQAGYWSALGGVTTAGIDYYSKTKKKSNTDEEDTVG